MAVVAFIPGRSAADERAEGNPTLAELKVQLRIDEPEGWAGDALLLRHLAAAKARADKQAPGAPAAIRFEAITRAVGWLWQGHEYSHSFWRYCGAEGLLKPWTVRRAGLIG